MRRPSSQRKNGARAGRTNKERTASRVRATDATRPISGSISDGSIVFVNNRFSSWNRSVQLSSGRPRAAYPAMMMPSIISASSPKAKSDMATSRVWLSTQARDALLLFDWIVGMPAFERLIDLVDELLAITPRRHAAFRGPRAFPITASSVRSTARGDRAPRARARRQQVVWNLLANAVKFSPKEGVVGIRVGRVDSDLQLTVVDNGAGIAVDSLSLMFESFRQFEGGTRERMEGWASGSRSRNTSWNCTEAPSRRVAPDPARARRSPSARPSAPSSRRPSGSRRCRQRSRRQTRSRRRLGSMASAFS